MGKQIADWLHEGIVATFSAIVLMSVSTLGCAASSIA
jgi:hypothetical protein